MQAAIDRIDLRGMQAGARAAQSREGGGVNLIEFGDCRDTMRRWAEQGVKAQMCVTSPPYFGLRSYMPDAVRLRDDLSEEERKAIEEELARLGVKPNFG